MLTDSLRKYIQKEFENLKNSSSLLRPLIESGSYGLALISSDFHVIEVNSKMLEWFPKTQVSSFPLCHHSFYSQTDSPCENCPAVKSLQDGKKHSVILEQKIEDNFITLKVSCTPIKGHDETVWGILELVEDITEKVLKEKELSSLEAHHKQIIENASDAIISFDIDGKIFQFNRKAQELFGYSLEEAKNMTLFSLMPEETLEQQKKILQEIFSNNDLVPSKFVEGICLKKDGTRVTIEATFSYQKTKGIQAITAILRDITVRKSYEEKLKTYAEELERKVESRTNQLLQSERRYRTLLGTANDSIISTDKGGSIIYINHKTQELFEYSKADILGKNLTKLIPEEIWETALQELEKKSFSSQGKMLESFGIK
jgi:PAS domain S-box-containing protein